ncbi:hypothetical protein [Streptomyces sp. NPDC006510]|uniref:hypothetical protein n=1 Tax=Streptomyces sp. NPDC006510 TaxID=3155600 RepID=UPI0033A0C20F
MARADGCGGRDGRRRRLQGAAPDSYTWILELERREEGLALYFFFSDPDNRNTYVLEKAR